jgi:hypothetical protein
MFFDITHFNHFVYKKYKQITIAMPCGAEGGQDAQ